MLRIRIHLLIGIFLVLGPPGTWAQEAASSITLDDVYSMLKKQQELIESQQATIDDQGKALAALSARLDQIAQMQPQTAGTRPAPVPAAPVSTEPRTADQQNLQRTQTGLPQDVMTRSEFPGSISIPGTGMAAKVGGIVRLAVVNNFDPLGSDDQFIAGSIPVPGDKRLFSIAIEDPTPGIANGTGKSDVPDLVSTINLPRKAGHIQLGALVRNLKGEQPVEPDSETSNGETRSDTTYGWGISPTLTSGIRNRSPISGPKAC